MNPLVMDEIGVNVTVKENCLTISSMGNRIHSFRPHDIDFDVVVLSNCNFGLITLQALSWLKAHNLQLLYQKWDRTIIAFAQNAGIIYTHDSVEATPPRE